MALTDQFIFQIDSLDVIQAFKSDNYSIEYDNEITQNQNNFCVIYFSSHGIYYPNNLESFNYSIIERDKYEWKRNKFPKVKKHIFLRDLHKQWYLTGINETLNNPEKILNFLKKETLGFRVITIGSSAGGYAALLFGSLLNCERIYAINAQFNLRVWMKNSDPINDPILFEKVNHKASSLYFDLSNFIKEKTDNYYFQSYFSKMDLEQFDGINKDTQKKIKIIRFLSSKHGIPFLRGNISFVLSSDKFFLESLLNKNNNPFLFSIRLIGIFPTLILILKELKELYFKKRLLYKLKHNHQN